jgi:hypothetical protein
MAVRADAPSSLQFVNLPDDAQIYVDGSQIAQPVITQNVARVMVDDGMRDVRVVSGGREIFSSRIFIQDGTTKRINLSN